jgi:transposase
MIDLCPSTDMIYTDTDSGGRKMEITTKQLDHHGLVAGTFDKFGMGEVIEKRIPKGRNCNLPTSTIIKAMIILGLGFVDRRLYFAGSYFANWDVERLLGEGVKAEDLNDDALGRVLDKIHDYGSTELFQEIAANALNKLEMDVHLVHIDTTSVSVSGDYELEDGTNGFKITFGHSKDHRQDLKQFVIGMVVNQHGMPLFVKAYKGNESDKESIKEMVKAIRGNIDKDKKVYHVADSAFYTAENIRELRTTYWISHVPSTIKEAQEMLNKEVEFRPTENEGYEVYSERSDYGGIKQKWVMVSSEYLKEQELKTFDKHLEKSKVEAEKSLKKTVTKERYFCSEDGINKARQWIETHPLFKYDKFDIKGVRVRTDGKRGRPKDGDSTIEMYEIDAEIGINEEMVEKAKGKLGRFILSTNDIELEDEKVLEYYKNQTTVERGFRFLKDKSFGVNDVYLKKPGRIEALVMIMVLTLLVYSLAEWEIRNRLRETGQTFPNQLKKPTNRPTFKWVCQNFMNITVVSVITDRQETKQIANLKDLQIKMIKLLGEEYEKYYF